jgi:hypothetical protein
MFIIQIFGFKQFRDLFVIKIFNNFLQLDKIGLIMNKLKLLLIIISFSCSGSKENPNVIFFSETDLPDAITLKGIKYDFSQLINPRTILFKEGYLIVGESKTVTDNKIHIIDIEEKKYIFNKGKDGLGPGEITMVATIEDRGQEGEFWTYDFEQTIFSRFDLYNENQLAEEQLNKHESSFFITDMCWASDSSLLANRVEGWTKYYEISISGETLKQFGSWKDMVDYREYPKGIKKDELESNVVSSIHQGNIRGNPAKEFFIKAGVQVDYIDIVNLKEQEIKTLIGPSNKIQDMTIGYSVGYQMPGMKEDIQVYRDSYAGKDSFFALFLNKPYKLMSEPNNLNRIFEFDYTGKILAQYQLDYPLLEFTVDENGRRFFGITYDAEPNIVEFKF